MTSRLVVLLPPSQHKSLGGRRGLGPGRFDEHLAVARAQLGAALREVVATSDATTLARLFAATGELVTRACASLADEQEGREQRLPAWRRYQGVVWSHLDPATLRAAQRRRILVPSGRFGLVAASDPIGDYRLKMNASVAPLGPLASFWRPLVTPLVLEASKGQIVLNLLPKEHAASLDFARLRHERRVVDVRFVAHDESSAVGHDAKAVKGVVARRALDGGLDAVVAAPWQDWTLERRGDEVIVTQPAARASTW